MFQIPVIAFGGESQHGKDQSGEWLVSQHGFLPMAFADVMKRLVARVFSFSTEDLWGPSHLRNVEKSVSWFEARTSFSHYANVWVQSLTNLTMEEKAAYRLTLNHWMDHCLEVSTVGEAGDPSVSKISPRIILQLLGTEYGRHFKETIWSDYLLDQVIPKVEGGWQYKRVIGVSLHKAPCMPSGIVITDCRFESEMAAIKERGGHVVKVVRLALKGKENQAEKWGIEGHQSEREISTIPDDAFTDILEFEEGLENVHRRLSEMYESRAWG